MSDSTVGIAIKVSADDLKRYVADLRAADRAANAADKEIRQLAKAILEQEKAAKQAESINAAMQNLGGGPAGVSGQQGVDNMLSGLAAAVEAQIAMAGNLESDAIPAMEDAAEASFSLELSWKGLVQGALALLATIPATAAGLFLFVSAVAEGADRLDDLAAKTGTTTEFLSSLGYGATVSGSSLEALDTALTTVTERAASAPAEFLKWGIAVTDANGRMRTTEELTVRAAEKMSTLSSVSERSALAMDLFGKSGRELVPLLENGAAGLKQFGVDADNLGITLSSASAAMAGEFNDQLAATEQSLGALMRQFAVPFMPLFTQAFVAAQGVLGKFAVYFRQNSEAIEAFARGAMQFLLHSLALFVDVGSAATYVAQGLVSVFTTRLSGAFDDARHLADNLSAASRTLAAEMDKGAKKTNDAVVPAINNENAARLGLVGTMKKERDEREKLLSELEGKVQALAELDDKSAQATRQIVGASIRETAQERLASARQAVIDQRAANFSVLKDFEDNEQRIIELGAKTAEDKATAKEIASAKLSAIDQLTYGMNIEQMRDLADQKVRTDQAAVASAIARRKQIGENVDEEKRKTEAAIKAEADATTALAGVYKSEAETAVAAQARKSEAIERAHKREQDLEKERTQTAQRSIALAMEKNSIVGLLSAWKQYYAARDSMDRDEADKTLKQLESSTKAQAATIVAGIREVIGVFKQELDRVGDIETETRQRIAIKSAKEVERSIKSTGQEVTQYVDHVTQEQIEAYERMGKKVEVVTETIGIHTRTEADAIASAFESLFLRLTDMIVGFLAQAAIMTFLSFATGGSLGFVGALGKVVGLNKGGPVRGYAGGGFVSGGIPGRDSVPAMLTPGEYVIPAPIVDDIRSGRSPQSGHYASGGTVAGSGASGMSRGTSSGGRPIVVLAPSRAHLRRIMRDTVEPEQRLLRRYGYEA